MNRMGNIRSIGRAVVCFSVLLLAVFGCGMQESDFGEISVQVSGASFGTVMLYRDSIFVGRGDFDVQYDMTVRFAKARLKLSPGPYQLRGKAGNGRNATKSFRYPGGFQSVTLPF